jgi:uncharacterized BrkB/YihY/UPF0761 family membrane protein
VIRKYLVPVVKPVRVQPLSGLGLCGGISAHNETKRKFLEVLIQILNSVLSLAVITLLFAMIFKFLPDAKIAWHDVWICALTTAALFTVGEVCGPLSWKERG